MRERERRKRDDTSDARNLARSRGASRVNNVRVYFFFGDVYSSSTFTIVRVVDKSVIFNNISFYDGCFLLRKDGER